MSLKKVKENKIYKVTRKTILFFLLFLFCLILFSNIAVLLVSKNKIYTDIVELPKNKTALILGTSKYLANTKGANNLFYKERIKTANDLFEAGKVNFLILSGSNPTKYYNEPVDMQKDLLKLGVPEDKMFLDYAGFRTLDSVVRSKEVFGQEKITLVSQKFHLQRALFLANFYGIDAVGFAAEDPKIGNFKVHFREVFARVKMLYDILVGVEPRFYGQKIEIR
ncbi:protein SanA [Candidatus Campbellbacteria bacterium]|nr:MAG: protein SanA [Candidatus Campbellbacteria bacterium]